MSNKKNKMVITIEKKTAQKDTQLFLKRSDLEFSDEVKGVEKEIEKDRTNPDLWMKKGLGLAKQMLFREAVEAYSIGLTYDPFNWELLRHRGHRFLSLHKFENAAADFELSSRLNKNDWDVWYHLGLSYYLLGDFERANEAYTKCFEMTDMKSINLVAIVNWKYLTLMRLGRQDEALSILQYVDENTEAGENEPYKDNVLVYKGLKTIDEALTFDNPEFAALEYSTRGYGIAINLYLHNEKQKAWEILNKIYNSDDFWSAFGYLGTCAEIANKRLEM